MSAEVPRRVGSGSGSRRTAARWTVYRTDDHGNEFPVRTFSRREDAEECARSFEARGHKQLYTVRSDA